MMARNSFQVLVAGVLMMGQPLVFSRTAEGSTWGGARVEIGNIALLQNSSVIGESADDNDPEAATKYSAIAQYRLKVLAPRVQQVLETHAKPLKLKFGALQPQKPSARLTELPVTPSSELTTKGLKPPVLYRMVFEPQFPSPIVGFFEVSFVLEKPLPSAKNLAKLRHALWKVIHSSETPFGQPSE